MTQATKVIKKRASVHQDMKDLFCTPIGERVIMHLIKTQGVLSPAHQKGNTCCDTAHQDGRRSVVLAMLNFINKDPRYFDSLLDRIERENEHE
tara:strand:+ start:1083 stop:1361 length:279 start_codon:yes stop_codon:yes gene_type:complete